MGIGIQPFSSGLLLPGQKCPKQPFYPLSRRLFKIFLHLRKVICGLGGLRRVHSLFGMDFTPLPASLSKSERTNPAPGTPGWSLFPNRRISFRKHPDRNYRGTSLRTASASVPRSPAYCSRRFNFSSSCMASRVSLNSRARLAIVLSSLPFLP